MNLLIILIPVIRAWMLYFTLIRSSKKDLNKSFCAFTKALSHSGNVFTGEESIPSPSSVDVSNKLTKLEKRR